MALPRRNVVLEYPALFPAGIGESPSAARGVRPTIGAFVLRCANSLRYYARAMGRLLGVVRRGAEVNDGKDFSATQASVFLDGFTFRRFVEECYTENARRMADFENDLLRPKFLPSLASAALSGLRLLPTRVASTAKS